MDELGRRHAAASRPATSAATAPSTGSTSSTWRPAGRRSTPSPTAGPGRFAALWRSSTPTRGMAGVAGAAGAPRRAVGGRALPPHPQLRPPPRPRRLLPVLRRWPPSSTCPVAMQAGTSGGLMPSECGQPITIDRAALYFPETRFVLSHLGWPWVDEAVAMALKFPNVYLGTGVVPAAPLAARGASTSSADPGRHKVLFGTNFPTVGHRHALGPARRARSRRRGRGGAARGEPPASVFTRLPTTRRSAHDRQGLRHAAPAAGGREHPLLRRRGRSRIGVEYRDVDPASLAATYARRPRAARRAASRSHPRAGSPTRACRSTCSTPTDGHEYLRFDVFDDEPALPLHPQAAADAEIVNNVIAYDIVAHGDMLDLGARAAADPAARRCWPRRAAATWRPARHRPGRDGASTRSDALAAHAQETFRGRGGPLTPHRPSGAGPTLGATRVGDHPGVDLEDLV